MREVVNRILQMTRFERVALFEAAVLMPAVAGSLRIAGLKSTMRWLKLLEGPGRVGRRVPPANVDVVQVIGDMVDIVARRHPAYKATCLPQSLVLWHLLRLNEEQPELQVGFNKNDTDVIAHAWVEVAGKVINDAPSVRSQYLPVDLQNSLSTSSS